MLTYYELAKLGFCPSFKYGYMKSLPKDWVLPSSCSSEIFKQLPLQLQIHYQTEQTNGEHLLK